jgi:hypothetical protein
MADTPPTDAVWRDRADWFEDTLAEARGGSAAEVGEHTAALLIELETVFCAGAWVATVILAAATVEAHLRERLAARGSDAPQYLNTLDLFLEAGLPEDYDWLRRHRNRLVHYAAEPYLTPDMHWFQAQQLEEEARRAVTLAAQAVYRP